MLFREIIFLFIESTMKQKGLYLTVSGHNAVSEF